jgi:hypothetical protein
MPNSLSADEQPNTAAGGDGPPVAPSPMTYDPPRLTRVGNVRDLLAGDGGTVQDMDPTAGDPQQSSPQ